MTSTTLSKLSSHGHVEQFRCILRITSLHQCMIGGRLVLFPFPSESREQEKQNASRVAPFSRNNNWVLVSQRGGTSLGLLGFWSLLPGLFGIGWKEEDRRQCFMWSCFDNGAAIIHVHYRVSGRRPAWEKNSPPFKVSPKIDIIMITMTTRMLIIRVWIISSYFFWALPKLPLPSAHPPARNLGNFFTFEKVSNLSRALSPPFVQCPKEMVFFSGKSALRLCC